MDVPHASGGLRLGALGRAGRFTAAGAAAGTLRTLPGLYREDKLIAAPASVRPLEEGERLDILGVECIVGQRLGIAAASPSA